MIDSTCTVQAGAHVGTEGVCLARETADMCEAREAAAGNYAACYAQLMGIRQQRDHADGRVAEAARMQAELLMRVEYLAAQMAGKDAINDALRDELGQRINPVYQAGIVLAAGVLVGGISALARGHAPDGYDGGAGLVGAAGAALVLNWHW